MTVTYGLELFWYIVIIASICNYAMLDGFDLGVGCLHLLARKDEERRIFLNAIGPVWDGNEVWLVVVIGAFLAGFPLAYATLFSSFYIPFTILITGLIFRACAIEFRSKVQSLAWRKTWDFLFFLASLIISYAVGIALGNLIYGIPLNATFDYTGGAFLDFLHPYALLTGTLVFSLFLMHGAIFLSMKTEGELHKKITQWINPTIIFFIITYSITTLVTLIYLPYMAERFRERPYLFIFVIMNMLAIANIPREVNRKKMGLAFLSSCANIFFLMILFALGTFPWLIRSTVETETHSITVTNAAATAMTLKVLSVIVAIGIPLVIAYGFYIYHIFRGKVRIDHTSY